MLSNISVIARTKARFDMNAKSIEQHCGSRLTLTCIDYSISIPSRSMHTLRIYSLVDAKFATNLPTSEEWKSLSEF